MTAPAEPSDAPVVAAADRVRVLGAVLVVYGYVVGPAAAWSPAIADLVVALRVAIAEPLGLGEDFGALGFTLVLIGQATVIATRPRRAAVGVLVAAVVGAGFTVAAAVSGLLDTDTALPAPPPLWPLLALLVAAGAVLLAGRIGARPAVPVLVLLVLGGVGVGVGALPGWGPVAAVAQFAGLVAVGLSRGSTMSGPLRVASGVAAVALPAVAAVLVSPLASWWYALACAYAVLGALLLGRSAAVASRPLRVAARRVPAVTALAGGLGAGVVSLVGEVTGGPVAVLLATAVVLAVAWPLGRWSR